MEYIKHSGFLVELEEAVFIFDYYQGKIKEIDPEKQIYFFVSHKHEDHFSFEIFEYAKKYKNVTFVLSNEIKMNEKYMNRRGVPVEARQHIVYAHKNSEFALGENLKVETLTSTDIGVAYIVTYKKADSQEVCIYHAGDLNWWTWSGESEKENEEMAKQFKLEMKKIEGRSFDLAFVPLDGRQEDRFWWGFDYFMKTANAAYAFPMHCWEDYSVIGRLTQMEEAAAYKDRVVSISHPEECFTIPLNLRKDIN